MIGVPMAAFPHDFYPRSPCGERRALHCGVPADRDISIHALLAESDAAQVRDVVASWYRISIHALLAESDGLCYTVFAA